MSDADLLEVSRLTHTYLEGLHHADVTKLRAVFHPTANLQSQNTRLTREEWLDRVVNRDAPSALSGRNDYQILKIDLVGEQAMVKVECPLFDILYIDFLSFLKEQSQWKIVNKMYSIAPVTDKPQTQTGE